MLTWSKFYSYNDTMAEIFWILTKYWQQNLRNAPPFPKLLVLIIHSRKLNFLKYLTFQLNEGLSHLFLALASRKFCGILGVAKSFQLLMNIKIQFDSKITMNYRCRLKKLILSWLSSIFGLVACSLHRIFFQTRYFVLIYVRLRSDSSLKGYMDALYFFLEVSNARVELSLTGEIYEQINEKDKYSKKSIFLILTKTKKRNQQAKIIILPYFFLVNFRKKSMLL